MKKLIVSFVSLFLVFAVSASALDPAAGTTSLADALDGLTLEQKAVVEGVDCDAGGTIGDALKSTRNKLVIWFTGTCQENFTVIRDEVTIRGLGDDPTVIGDIIIEGATRVKLRDFTVRDSAEAAIDIRQGSHATLINIDVLESAIRGILIEESAGDFENIRVVTTLGGTVGILNRASTITLKGDIEASGFLVSGISATLGARYWINDGHLNLHDNPGSGAIFQINAGITFSRGSITANNNGFAGLFITNGAKMVHGNVVIETNGNAVAGILLNQFANTSAFIGFGGDITANGNGLGGIITQSTSSFNSGLSTIETSGNGQFGIVGAALSRVELLSPTTAEGNGVAPLGAVLGSQLTTSDAVTVDGPLFCDSTVIVQGPVVCPSNFGGVDVSKMLEGVRNSGAVEM